VTEVLKRLTSVDVYLSASFGLLLIFGILGYLGSIPVTKYIAVVLPPCSKCNSERFGWIWILL
jgi:hypothetical protein